MILYRFLYRVLNLPVNSIRPLYLDLNLTASLAAHLPKHHKLFRVLVLWCKFLFTYIYLLTYKVVRLHSAINSKNKFILCSFCNHNKMHLDDAAGETTTACDVIRIHLVTIISIKLLLFLNLGWVSKYTSNSRAGREV